MSFINQLLLKKQGFRYGSRMTTETSGVDGRLVLISGGTSASGSAVARALISAGARVVLAGRDPEKLRIARESIPGVQTEKVDLCDERQVLETAGRIRTTGGRVDGVLHLVGGWRGGGGLAGQYDDDYRALEQTLTSLRHVSRAFDGDLRSSTAGRIAIVSSTTVQRPAAGGANYASVKAACETWIRAVAQGFEKHARAHGGPPAVATIFRTGTLGGLEEALARQFIALWQSDNGRQSLLERDVTTGEH